MQSRFPAISLRVLFALLLGFTGSFCCFAIQAQDRIKSEEGRASQARPESENEARREARLLHETLHAMLHMIHIRYFHKDAGLPLPATSFKMVFSEIEKARNVKVRWLAVSLPAMHLDHEARDAFERDAIKALSGGDEYFDRVDGNRYRFAGPITMGSECLSCHSPTHTNTEPRIGGLLISMELKPK